MRAVRPGSTVDLIAARVIGTDEQPKPSERTTARPGTEGGGMHRDDARRLRKMAKKKRAQKKRAGKKKRAGGGCR